MNLSIVQSTRLFQNLPDAFVLQRLLYDDLGHPEDFVILDTNKAFSSLFNLTHYQASGKKGSDIWAKQSHLVHELMRRYDRLSDQESTQRFEMIFGVPPRLYEITICRDSIHEVMTFFRTSFAKNTDRNQNETETNFTTTAHNLSSAAHTYLGKDDSDASKHQNPKSVKDTPGSANNRQASETDDHSSEHVRHMELLLKLSHDLMIEQTTEALTQAIVDGVSQLSYIHSAAIYLTDNQQLFLGATYPPLPKDFPMDLRRARKEDHPHITRSIETGEPVVIEDCQTAHLSKAERIVCETRGLRSFLFIPLIYQGRSLGVLITGTTEKPYSYSNEEIGFCQTLASHVSLVLTDAIQTERLYAFHNNTPSLISEFDLDGHYLHVNDALASKLNQSATTLIGRSFDELLPHEMSDMFMDRINTVRKTSKSMTTEDYLELNSGSSWFLTTLFPLYSFDGSVASIGAISHDITQLKQTEIKLVETANKYRKGLEGIIHTMGALMNIRDNYTASHQNKVAALAEAIAIELGLDENKVAGIRYAAEVHDIGKLAVPSDILSKPGKMSQLEYSLIQTHAMTGYDILQNIEFPWPLADIVAQHHEKIDGSGYPNALKGDDILLEAKIICVADVVEAMASHRPYRPAHPLHFALEEIEKHQGILFDPVVVAACLKLFHEKKFQFTQPDV